MANISDEGLNFVMEQQEVKFITAFRGRGSKVIKHVSLSYRFTTPVFEL